MTAKIRVGVVGLRRGQNFIRVLKALPDTEITALVDPDLSQRAAAKALLGPAGASVIEADYLPDLLDSSTQIDLVILSLPPIGRVSLVEMALERGIHVLSEIPAIWAMDEAERLVKAVEQSKAKYMMAENCVWWGFIQSLKAMRERGDLGRVFHTEAEMSQDMRPGYRYPNGDPTWRMQRVNPLAYCSHSVGPMLRVTGAYPVSVIAMGVGDNFEPGIDDLQTALIRMSDGSSMRLAVTLSNAHWHGHRFTVYGTRSSYDSGWVWMDQPKYWTESIPNLTAPIPLTIGPDTPGAPAAAKSTGEATMNWLMLRAFLDSIHNDSQPPVDVYDALMFSLPGLCGGQSARNNGALVDIPQYQLRRK